MALDCSSEFCLNVSYIGIQSKLAMSTSDIIFDVSNSFYPLLVDHLGNVSTKKILISNYRFV